MNKGFKSKELVMIIILICLSVLPLSFLALVNLEGDRTQGQIFSKLSELQDIKVAIHSIEKRILRVRQNELLFLKGQTLGRFDMEEELLRTNASIRTLARRIKDKTLAQSLVPIEKIVDRYATSVHESFEVSSHLSLKNKRGQLVELRHQETLIHEKLAQRGDGKYSDTYNLICLSEREFTYSRDMHLADVLKSRTDQFHTSLSVSLDEKPLLALIDAYRQVVAKIMSTVAAMELNTARNSLHFNRFNSRILSLEESLDKEMSKASTELSTLRRSLMIKAAIPISLVLILMAILVVVFYRRRTRQVWRLRQLLAGMEVGEGKANPSLPPDNDELNNLTKQFLDMTGQLNAQSETIKQERQKAKHANQTKDRFLANMSHEIRTPMNGVMGMLEILENSRLTPVQMEYVRLLRHSGRALLAIINDILDYSKIEAGLLELDMQPFDLIGCAQETVVSIIPKAHEKKLSLDLEISKEVPALLLGDMIRLRQVLTHLLNNAVKFTTKGSVLLKIAVNKHQGTRVDLEFRVIDTGLGIDLEIRKHIFDPFVQGESDSRRSHGGTGLGLSICRLLVERMSGTIQAESLVGQGTQFYFLLPFEVVDVQGDRESHFKPKQIESLGDPTSL